MPAVILATVITDQTVAAIYPVAWVQVIARAPARYARAVGMFAASLVAFWIVKLVVAISVGMVPIIGGLVVGTACNLG